MSKVTETNQTQGLAGLVKKLQDAVKEQKQNLARK